MKTVVNFVAIGTWGPYKIILLQFGHGVHIKCKQNWSLPDQKGVKSWVQIIIVTVLTRANRTRKKWASCSNSCPHFSKCLQSNVTTVRHSQRNFHKKTQLTIRMQKFEEQKIRVKKYLTSENFVYINSGLGWVGIKAFAAFVAIQVKFMRSRNNQKNEKTTRVGTNWKRLWIAKLRCGLQLCGKVRINEDQVKIKQPTLIQQNRLLSMLS